MIGTVIKVGLLAMCALLFKVNAVLLLCTSNGQRWLDEYLKWDKEVYGNVETIRIPANTIWTPDLVISNLYVVNFSSPI